MRSTKEDKRISEVNALCRENRMAASGEKKTKEMCRKSCVKQTAVKRYGSERQNYKIYKKRCVLKTARPRLASG